jgi:hypothetical protein
MFSYISLCLMTCTYPQLSSLGIVLVAVTAARCDKLAVRGHVIGV